MDKLSAILNNVSFEADVFFSGNMCGVQTLGGIDNSKGHLHLLKSGRLTIICEEGHKVVLDRPAIIFMPGKTKHQIKASEPDNAELVCVDIEFNGGTQNALIEALPKIIFITLEQSIPLGKTAHWLFEEAFNQHSGHKVITDKLCDIFLVQILRHVLDEGVVVQGMLSGMSHPGLAKLMSALHKQPQKNWTVDSMAEFSAMSRAKFAFLFKDTVGQSPNDYLSDLRIAVAQGLLKKDKPVSFVANEVGYEHGSTLARVFRKKVGLSPREWLDKVKRK